MSNSVLFGPDQGWSLEPVATWLYTEGRRLRDAGAGGNALPPPDLEARIARATYGYLAVAAPAERMARHTADQGLPSRVRRTTGKAAPAVARQRGHAA